MQFDLVWFGFDLVQIWFGPHLLWSKFLGGNSKSSLGVPGAVWFGPSLVWIGLVWFGPSWLEPVLGCKQ